MLLMFIFSNKFTNVYIIYIIFIFIINNINKCMMV